MRTNADLTLYNKYVASNKERFQRTELRGVMWENRKGRNLVASGGNVAADQAAIYIPMTLEGFLAPREWQAFEGESGDEEALPWTLQVGDLVVKGLVEDEITPEFSVSQLKAKYNDVLQVTSVDTMDAGSPSIQHWQVGAK